MKTLKYFVAISVAFLVVVGITTAIRAEGLRHLVWQTPGTNLTTVAWNDTTTSPAIIPSAAAGHNRLFATITNTNAGSAMIAVKLGLFACCTNATPDVYVPAASSYKFDFGEGYNGPISIRNTNGAAGVTFQYWDGGN